MLGRVFAGEGLQDGEDGEGNLIAVEPGGVAAEGAPCGELGVEAAPGERRRARDGGPEAVMAAEVLVAQGGPAASAAVGQDETTFEGHSVLRDR
jgi:hypothetical protein